MFGCTCWTLELSSHIVENLWSGTTETKSPQEFLLARVPANVMDILNDLLLARRQRFPNNCSTVATIFIVKRRFVRHHLVSSIAVLVEVMLLCLCRKGTSRVQNFQVRPRLRVTRRFFGVWPVRFPNRYTRSPRGRATSSPSNHA